MDILKNKVVYFISTVAIVATGFYIYTFLTTAPQQKTLHSSNQSPNLSSNVEKISSTTSIKEEQKLDPTKPIAIDGKSYILMSPTEMGDLANWMSERGYFEKRNIDAYKTYSSEVLKELAKKGDIMALDVLTANAIEAHDEKAARLYMNMAVVYGSTGALQDLTIYTRPRSTNDATENDRKPAVLETLAVAKVIALRGEKSLADLTTTNFINGYKQIYNIDLILTPDEEIIVDNRAQEIYDKFQELRKEEGLGDFDNSEPTGVKKFFGRK